jgi:hypothetical protein
MAPQCAERVRRAVTRSYRNLVEAPEQFDADIARKTDLKSNVLHFPPKPAALRSCLKWSLPNPHRTSANSELGFSTARTHVQGIDQIKLDVLRDAMRDFLQVARCDRDDGDFPVVRLGHADFRQEGVRRAGALWKWPPSTTGVGNGLPFSSMESLPPPNDIHRELIGAAGALCVKLDFRQEHRRDVPAQLQNLRLARQRQGVRAVDHRLALSMPDLVSALSKKTFSSVNSPIRAGSPPRFGMQRLHIGSRCRPNSFRTEYPFPRAAETSSR